ncbi:hypothetical protein MHBO_001215 [Bonamia ostreae]|uniref:Uncharacterized protein n=1 Tax=Bonamia ostreae TaxID=126728 RepID=A0ABV2AI60_9EUKA
MNEVQDKIDGKIIQSSSKEVDEGPLSVSERSDNNITDIDDSESNVIDELPVSMNEVQDKIDGEIIQSSSKEVDEGPLSFNEVQDDVEFNNDVANVSNDLPFSRYVAQNRIKKGIVGIIGVQDKNEVQVNDFEANNIDEVPVSINKDVKTDGKYNGNSPLSTSNQKNNIDPNKIYENKQEKMNNNGNFDTNNETEIINSENIDTKNSVFVITI